ncbi:hypothetical protein MJI47_29080, partial [Salmonella enterica subsp. enterica serovar Kentucky]|nr:hypothetical protein [Salmonella enterica subsp. enterica serovar Kentucky]
INPQMKVGCMLAMVALYPFSCKPEDVMFAQESMRERYVFTDVMGLTELAPGNLWNTMPCHTHERRMEVYLYFNMEEDSCVFHMM